MEQLAGKLNNRSGKKHLESNEPDEAVTMVVTRSDFFREILSKGKEFISIKEEEKHISSYLQIQEMRYRDILEYDNQLDINCFCFPRNTA